MKILLFGQRGQVGGELHRSLATLGELVALHRDSCDFGADFEHPQAVAATVRKIQPNIIVNAVAHTAVDKAESEPDLVRMVNVTTPTLLAYEANRLNAWLVHYSSDYVFDGSSSCAYAEDAPTGPLNVYGQSKLDADVAISSSGCNHLILRTSWVYSAHRKNFAKKTLRLASEGQQLTVVDDQFGAPTGADLLASVTAHCLRVALVKPNTSGTYHVTAAGETSWHGYARFVLAWAQRHRKLSPARADALRPVPTRSYPTPARRPLNSRLATNRLQATFGVCPPPWQLGVQQMLSVAYLH